VAAITGGLFYMAILNKTQDKPVPPATNPIGPGFGNYGPQDTIPNGTITAPPVPGVTPIQPKPQPTPDPFTAPITTPQLPTPAPTPTVPAPQYDAPIGPGLPGTPPPPGPTIPAPAPAPAPTLPTPKDDLGGGDTQEGVIDAIDKQNQDFYDQQEIQAKNAYDTAVTTLNNYKAQQGTNITGQKDIALQELENNVTALGNQYNTSRSNAEAARLQAESALKTQEESVRRDAETAKQNLTSQKDEALGETQVRENQRLLEYERGITNIKQQAQGLQRQMLSYLSFLGSGGSSVAAALAERLGTQLLGSVGDLQSQRQTQLGEISAERGRIGGEFQRGSRTIESQLQGALGDVSSNRGKLAVDFQSRMGELENEYNKVTNELSLSSVKINQAFQEAQGELENNYATSLQELQGSLQQNQSSISAARIQSAQDKASAKLQAWQDYSDRKSQLDMAIIQQAQELASVRAQYNQGLQQFTGAADGSGGGFGFESNVYGIDNQSVGAVGAGVGSDALGASKLGGFGANAQASGGQPQQSSQTYYAGNGGKEEEDKNKLQVGGGGKIDTSRYNGITLPSAFANQIY